MMEFCDKCQDSCECYYHGCKEERLGGGGSEPTTCPRSAERGEGKAKVKSGGSEATGARTTAHIHGRRCRHHGHGDDWCEENQQWRYNRCKACIDYTGERSDLNDEPVESQPVPENVESIFKPKNQAERSVDAKAEASPDKL